MKANQKAELYREAYYWDLMALIRKLKQKYGSEATPVKAATETKKPSMMDSNV